MKKLLAYILTNSISLIMLSGLLSGVYIRDLKTTILLSLVLGLLNSTVKPVLKILSLPLTIMTFGFFSIIVNAFVLSIAFSLTRGASMNGFFTAIIASVLFGIINSFVESLFKD
ncbi:MAG: phage holin family protein [Erysipelotrichaceae bacterium]|nr:phage holin family protein [Erysipelotrichaceae bacterium]